MKNPGDVLDRQWDGRSATSMRPTMISGQIHCKFCADFFAVRRVLGGCTLRRREKRRQMWRARLAGAGRS